VVRITSPFKFTFTYDMHSFFGFARSSRSRLLFASTSGSSFCFLFSIMCNFVMNFNWRLICNINPSYLWILTQNFSLATYLFVTGWMWVVLALMDC
jgi:hypothetical protein